MSQQEQITQAGVAAPPHNQETSNNIPPAICFTLSILAEVPGKLESLAERIRVAAKRYYYTGHNYMCKVYMDVNLDAQAAKKGLEELIPLHGFVKGQSSLQAVTKAATFLTTINIACNIACGSINGFEQFGNRFRNPKTLATAVAALLESAEEIRQALSPLDY